jgi:phage-related minor tail protein
MGNLTESQYAKDIRVYDAGNMVLNNQSVIGEKNYHMMKKITLKQWKYVRIDAVVTEICNIIIYIILGINTLLKKVTIGDFSSLVQSTIQFKESMENI